MIQGKLFPPWNLKLEQKDNHIEDNWNSIPPQQGSLNILFLCQVITAVPALYFLLLLGTSYSPNIFFSLKLELLFVVYNQKKVPQAAIQSDVPAPCINTSSISVLTGF